MNKGEDWLDVLKSLFGNVTSSILRLAVIAGTLALIYVFAIRPTIDAAKDIGGPINQSIQELRDENPLEEFQQAIREQTQSNDRRVQRQLNQAFNQAAQPGGANPQSLLRCVKRANGDVQVLQACSRRFN